MEWIYCPETLFGELLIYAAKIISQKILDDWCSEEHVYLWGMVSYFEFQYSDSPGKYMNLREMNYTDDGVNYVIKTFVMYYLVKVPNRIKLEYTSYRAQMETKSPCLL